MDDDTTLDFRWKGREMNNLGDLVSALGGLTDPEEAVAFKEAYARALRASGVSRIEVTKLASDNLGYLCGYLGRADMLRLLHWLDVDHPVFGRTPMTPEDAFKAGGEWIQTGVTPKDREELENFEQELRHQERKRA